MTRQITTVPGYDVVDDSGTDVKAIHNIPAADAATQDTIEDQILAVIMLDQALERLPAPFRALMELLYAYRPSPGYDGLWPPTARDVGRYLGDRFYQGTAVPVSTVWRWHSAVLAHWSRARSTNNIPNAFITLHYFTPIRPIVTRAA